MTPIATDPHRSRQQAIRSLSTTSSFLLRGKHLLLIDTMPFQFSFQLFLLSAVHLLCWNTVDALTTAQPSSQPTTLSGGGGSSSFSANPQDYVKQPMQILTTSNWLFWLILFFGIVVACCLILLIIYFRINKLQCCPPICCQGVEDVSERGKKEFHSFKIPNPLEYGLSDNDLNNGKGNNRRRTWSLFRGRKGTQSPKNPMGTLEEGGDDDGSHNRTSTNGTATLSEEHLHQLDEDVLYYTNQQNFSERPPYYPIDDDQLSRRSGYFNGDARSRRSIRDGDGGVDVIEIPRPTDSFYNRAFAYEDGGSGEVFQPTESFYERAFALEAAQEADEPSPGEIFKPDDDFYRRAFAYEDAQREAEGRKPYEPYQPSERFYQRAFSLENSLDEGDIELYQPTESFYERAFALDSKQSPTMNRMRSRRAMSTNGSGRSRPGSTRSDGTAFVPDDDFYERAFAHEAAHGGDGGGGGAWASSARGGGFSGRSFTGGEASEQLHPMNRVKSLRQGPLPVPVVAQLYEPPRPNTPEQFHDLQLQQQYLQWMHQQQQQQHMRQQQMFYYQQHQQMHHHHPQHPQPLQHKQGSFHVDPSAVYHQQQELQYQQRQAPQRQQQRQPQQRYPQQLPHQSAGFIQENPAMHHQLPPRTGSSFFFQTQGPPTSPAINPSAPPQARRSMYNAAANPQRVPRSPQG